MIEGSENNDNNTQQPPPQDNSDDPLLEEAVRRLEDRAVQYRPAEEVQTLACHLAPALTARGIARLAPLHKQRDNNSNTYNLTALQQFVTANPAALSSSTKRRRSSTALVGTGDDGGGGDYEDEQLQGREEDHDDADEAGDTERLLGDTSAIKKRRIVSGSGTDLLRVSSRPSSSFNPGAAAVAVWEDSPEFAVSKTILELARLTLHSLRHADDDADERRSPLRTEDSILSMAGGSRHHREATVAAILPYAPVLRHRHVAVRTLSRACCSFGHDWYVWQ